MTGTYFCHAALSRRPSPNLANIVLDDVVVIVGFHCSSNCDYLRSRIQLPCLLGPYLEYSHCSSQAVHLSFLYMALHGTAMAKAVQSAECASQENAEAYHNGELPYVPGSVLSLLSMPALTVEGAALQAAQVRTMLGAMRAMQQKAGQPSWAMLMGDFNSIPGSAIYRYSFQYAPAAPTCLLVL